MFIRYSFHRIVIITKIIMQKSATLSAPPSVSTNSITNLTEFLSKTERLLQLEKTAEYEQNRMLIESRNLDELCHSGMALKKLRLLNYRTGLGGRVLVKFGYSESSESGRPLSNHKLSPGDTVNLCPSDDHRTSLTSGVVSKVVEHSITVAIDDERSRDKQETVDFSLESTQNRTFTLIQSVNDVTFRRLNTSLQALKDYKKYPGWILVEYFFGLRTLPMIDLQNENIDQPQIGKHPLYFNEHLNSPQRAAVDFCINDRHPISIVHGPPGTGKTTVIVEIIRQLIKSGKKVLACAPSNVAVDNLIEKLTLVDDEDHPFQVIRLGHPARTHPNIQKYSLDLVLKTREYSAVLDDIRNEIANLEKEKDRRYANTQRRRLRQELTERERSAVRMILQNANVVCGTLTSITRNGPLGHLLKDNDDDISIFSSFGRRFDAAIIDECGQATEIACWSALLAISGEKCVLAGDHLQLPPTIISESAVKDGFDRSLMARATEELGEQIVKMLTIQYRMNTDIMNWPSMNVYDGRLEAHESVAKRLLSDIPKVESIEETESPLWLIDTTDCDMPEIVTVDDESKANIGEVRLVFLHVSRLVHAGVPQKSIAIISPYNLQVQLLRTYVGGVYPQVAIRSVDGFQGQEKDAVVLSLVRSNDRAEVGFLAERRRMNVAVTRAKRHLAVICNGRTVASDQFLRSLIEYVTKNGIVKSALEYEDDYHTIPFSINLDGLVVGTTATSPAQTKGSAPSKQRQQKPRATKSKSNASASTAEKRNTDTDVLLDWRDELRNQLQAFAVNQDVHQLDFPSTLLAHQRAYIHEVAGEIGLHHESKNIGSQRHIIVRKAIIEKTTSIDTTVTSTDIHSPAQLDQSSPSAQLDIQPPSSIGKASKTEHKSTAEKQKSKTSKPIPNQAFAQPDLDNEKLMEKFAHEERHCKFGGCKEPTLLLGEKCRFCILIFCLKHAMPEIHGCGEAAKRHARMEFERTSSGATKMMKGTSQKNAEKQERLYARLDDKLKTLKEQRQQKKSK